MLRLEVKLPVTETVTLREKVFRETGVITDSWTLLTVLSSLWWQPVYSFVRVPDTPAHRSYSRRSGANTHFGWVKNTTSMASISGKAHLIWPLCPMNCAPTGESIFGCIIRTVSVLFCIRDISRDQGYGKKILNSYNPKEFALAPSASRRYDLNLTLRFFWQVW